MFVRNEVKDDKAEIKLAEMGCEFEIFFNISENVSRRYL